MVLVSVETISLNRIFLSNILTLTFDASFSIITFVETSLSRPRTTLEDDTNYIEKLDKQKSKKAKELKMKNIYII